MKSLLCSTLKAKVVPCIKLNIYINIQLLILNLAMMSTTATIGCKDGLSKIACEHIRLCSHSYLLTDFSRFVTLEHASHTSSNLLHA